MLDSPPPVAGATPVGRTDNTSYYRLDPDLLLVVPDAGLKDNGASAIANTDFQLRYAAELGRPVAVVVHMTSLLSQDADARHTYAERMDPGLFYAAALVAGNPISRAIASFFLGLTRPKIPTRVHPSYETAIAWAATMRPAGSP